MVDHRTMPLGDALQHLMQDDHAAFYTPGHKRGQGSHDAFAKIVGQSAFQADIPELPELDNLFAPQGAIADAQALAADAFGADRTWFLVNGSTSGVIAAIIATCAPGDQLILPRNVHRSAIVGLILSGAVPVFVTPEYDPSWDLVYSITPQGVAQALAQHPDSRAVLMVYPTYEGVCGDLGTIANLAHQHGLPLLVDEAHGAHFHFHPDLPPSALSLGADLVVQSTHKVLSAFTQAAMIHTQGDRIASDRLSQALALVQSTSPSNLLLGSLDAARQQMALHGKDLMTTTLQLASLARTELAQLSNLSILSLSHPSPAFMALDPTRLTVNVAQLGMTGFEADDRLRQAHRVICELPALQNLTFILSLGNTDRDIQRLVSGLKQLVKSAQLQRLTGSKPLPSTALCTPSTTVSPFPTNYHTLVLTPREAFFAPRKTVPIAEAIDRVSAELICPYPPGIPTVIPGEVITASMVDYLRQILTAGGYVTGCADSRLETIAIIH
ncbi:MAG: aminotransferase class I/II-fold pyridoxal phosphate-dependent enzyme [Cyanobacteria bacterium]|nr:aminotransferase class I/II-fold pyridoxal phosphate-dependent enzyme [Cyanobacteriota bacterium]MDW8200472.1 aminotransferase class I/II-fold pyridoxal phosphate-dependent enzyme [Cyanobacteriota bacterium SKYGB_h_bin112]